MHLSKQSSSVKLWLIDVVLAYVWGAEKGHFPPCMSQVGEKSCQKNSMGLPDYPGEEIWGQAFAYIKSQDKGYPNFLLHATPWG